MADNKEKYERVVYNEENDTATKNARDRMNTLSTARPTYTDNWSSSLNTLATDILNGKKFSYDLNGDALYQQYKDQYINQGRLAMADTIGQASAMTGGYGSSYATTAGSQAYQGYLQQLNDRVPELYQLALDKYNSDRQDLYNQYGVISDRENTEYGRHRDSVSDWQYDYTNATNEYWNNKNFGYGKHTDDEDFRYTEYRNSIADELKDAELAASLGDFSKLKALGYDTSKAETAFNASSSGGNGGGGGNKGTTTIAKASSEERDEMVGYVESGDLDGLEKYLKGLFPNDTDAQDYWYEWAGALEVGAEEEPAPYPTATTTSVFPDFKDKAKAVILGDNAKTVMYPDWGKKKYGVTR